MISSPIASGLRAFHAPARVPTLIATPVAYSTGSWQHETSTFSGWGFNLGIRQNVQRVAFYVRAWSPLHPITRIRARVRDLNKNGTVRADKTVPVSCPLKQAIKVVIDFESPVANTAAVPLWFEWFSDGRAGGFEVDSSGYPVGSWPISTNAHDSNPENPAISDNAVQITQYVELYSLASSQDRTGDLLQRRLCIEGPLAAAVTPRQAFRASYAFGNPDPFAAGVWISDLGTFSGWGTPTGNPGPFSGLQFWIKSWSPAEPITRILVRVRDTNKTGAILASRTLSVNAPTGRFHLVTCDFGYVVTPPPGGIWVEWLTNGRTGRLDITVPLIAAKAGYVTTTELGETVMTDTATNANVQVTFGTVDPTAVGDLAPTPASLNLWAPRREASVLVPATLYALEGRELNLYFEQAVRTNLPRSSRDFRVTCAKGAQYNDWWRYTPGVADAGTTSLTLDVYDDGRLLTSKSVSLVTKALAAGTGVARKLLCIGDSTLGGSGQSVLAELVNLFSSDAMSLSLVGSQSASKNDSGATPRTIRGEAITGWTIQKFYSDSAATYTKWQGGTGTGSPFVFGGNFNFAQYLSTNSITLAANDWVLIHLGINDLFGAGDDASVSTTMAAMMAQLNAMITGIKAVVAGIRIGLCLTIPPSNQDGFGSAYGAGQRYRRYVRSWQSWVETMLLQWDNGAQGNVYLCPLHLSLDTVNNFPSSAVAFNARNPATYNAIANPGGVHPADSGYYQRADTIAAFLKGFEA